MRCVIGRVLCACMTYYSWPFSEIIFQRLRRSDELKRSSSKRDDWVQITRNMCFFSLTILVTTWPDF